MEILTSSPKCSYCHSCTYNVVKNTPQPTPWANNLEQWRGVTATVLRFSTKAITWVLPKLYPWQVGWRQAWEATRVIFSVPSPSPPLTSSLSHAERESAASSPAAATPLSFRAPPPQPTPAAAEKGARPPPPPLPSRRGRRARAPWGKGRPRSSACARRGRRLAVATVTREAAPGPAASPPERPGAPPGEAPPRPQPHGSGRYLRLVREKGPARPSGGSTCGSRGEAGGDYWREVAPGAAENTKLCFETTCKENESHKKAWGIVSALCQWFPRLPHEGRWGGAAHVLSPRVPRPGFSRNPAASTLQSQHCPDGQRFWMNATVQCRCEGLRDLPFSSVSCVLPSTTWMRCRELNSHFRYKDRFSIPSAAFDLAAMRHRKVYAQ